MYIFLDSNILRKDSRIRSMGMQAISYYSRIGMISLCLPEVVREEIISYNYETADRILIKISESLGELEKAGLSDSGHVVLSGIRKKIDKEKIELKTSINARFIDWMLTNNVQIQSSTEHAYTSAMNAYFNGLPPFTKAREKEHLPDAIIYFTIKKFIEENKKEDVYFISNDNNLMKYMRLLDCEFYSNIEDLVDSQYFKGYLEDNILDHDRDIMKIFSDGIIKNFRIVSTKILYDLQETFESVTELNLPSITHANPKFSGLRHLAITRISPKSIIRLSESKISIEFHAIADASISYLIHKSTFERYDFGQRELVIDEQEDDFLVQESITLRLEGRASIHISPKNWTGVLYHDRVIQRNIEDAEVKIISNIAYPQLEREHLIDFDWIDVTKDNIDSHNIDDADSAVKIFTDSFGIDDSLLEQFPPEEEDLPF